MVIGFLMKFAISVPFLIGLFREAVNAAAYEITSWTINV